MCREVKRFSLATYDSIAFCFSVCSLTYIDLVFIVEALNQQSWTSMLSYVNSVVDRLNIGGSNVRVAFISYGSGVQNPVLFYHYGDRPSLENAIRNIQYIGSGSDNLADALNNAQSLFSSARSGAAYVVVIITDRLPDGSTNQYVAAANALKAGGIWITGVGVTNPGQFSSNLMSQIVTNNLYTTVGDYSQLSQTSNQVGLQFACQAPITTSTTTSTSTTTTPTIPS